MPKVTILFGAVLVALGLFAYFGSASENPSPTALIPAVVGAILIVCGLVGMRPDLRKHAMHAGAMVGTIGAIAALGRGLPKIGLAASDDITYARPVRLVLLMAIICLVYVALCVRSFIVARRRRLQATGD